MFQLVKLKRLPAEVRRHVQLGREQTNARRQQSWSREALAALRNNCLYNIACALALRAEKNDHHPEMRAEALSFVERSVKAGYSDYRHMRNDRDLRGLRNEPRFRKLLDQLAGREKYHLAEKRKKNAAEKRARKAAYKSRQKAAQHASGKSNKQFKSE